MTQRPSDSQPASVAPALLVPHESLVADEIAALKARLSGEVARNTAASRETISEAESLAREVRGSRPMMRKVVEASSGDHSREARLVVAASAQRQSSLAPASANQDSITERFRALR